MPFFADIGKLLLIFGGISVLLGLFFTLGGKIPFLGKLPEYREELDKNSLLGEGFLIFIFSH